MISLRFVNHRNHEVSLHHYVTLKKCFWRPVICILIKDHRMNCKRLYFDYVWNKYILINKTEWLLTVLKKKMVRLWDDIQRFGVLTKTASVQVFSAILPWCLHSIYVCGQSLSRVWLLVNPWTVGSSVHRDSLGKNTSELPCSPPGDLPHPEIKARSPALQADSLPSESPGKPINTGVGSLFLHQGIFPTLEPNPGLLHCR